MSTPAIPVIDLFAGPGGLGEGFSAVRDRTGKPVFRLALSIEKDPFAVQTLRLRAFLRNFETPPDEYYDVACAHPDDQAVAVETLFNLYRDEADASRRQVLPATLGGTRWQTVYNEIDNALDGLRSGDPWVLIGGPPCQAYSLVGRARMKGKVETRQRARLHRLYRVYLRLLDRYRPPVFVMENVKGLLSAKVDGAPVFQKILRNLKHPEKGEARYVIQPLVISNREQRSLFESDDDTSVDHRRFIIKAEDFGIPQTRHRVILLGIERSLHERLRTDLPGLLEHGFRIGIAEAIGDLPRLRSGLSRADDESLQWRKLIESVPQSEWVSWLRSHDCCAVADEIEKTVRLIGRDNLERNSSNAGPSVPGYRSDWFADPAMRGISNHETRGHIAEDIERYLFAACYASVTGRSPRLADFPPTLRPDHRNVARAISEGLFADRFKVQISRDAEGRPAPATTITSHISKDGHYYIHYDATQCRSLTVREAARIQTFPDNYVFVGPRTEQYRQVGNAVPPLLAYQIGRVVARILAPALSVPKLQPTAHHSSQSTTAHPR